MALIRWPKSLKAVGLIKIILFLFRRVQNKREHLWNIRKTALKFWVLSIDKSGLKFWNRDTGFCCEKWRAKTDFDAEKSGLFFSFYSQRLTSERPLLEEILFGFPGKCKTEIHERDLLIEIHFVNGFLSVEKSFLDFMFYRKFRIPDFKIKIQIRNS